MWKLFIPFIVGLLNFRCASNELLKQADYAEARASLQLADSKEALVKFPTNREKKGFITTIERSWLGLLHGQTDTKTLVKISDQLDKREVILVSREAQQFFYQETEEGYYPAEHEIIWLHLVTGMQFAMQQNREGARVEAQRAALRLQGHEESKTGDFDDPILRLWLASLWIYCGEWEHARVDLRVAAQLSDQLAYLKKVADRDSPPTNLHLLLEGTGPEPEWRSEEKLKFSLKPKALTFAEAAKDVVSLPTSHWYQRHQERNTAIRDVLEKSKYMIHAGAVETSTAAGYGFVGTVTAIGALTAGAIVVGTVVLAAYILDAMAQGGGGSNSGELLGYVLAGGFAFGGYIFDQSTSFFNNSSSKLKEYRKENLDRATQYRFVRFIPDWMSFSLQSNVKATPFAQLTSPDQKSKISFYYAP